MASVFYTAKQLAERGSGEIPRELSSSAHLIFSSPAALAFHSPGAEGYGVKRAGLAVPGSVMLIVSPGCCGRNTSSISRLPGYEDRFFYLTMDETDLVTGRHLKKIPGAVAEVCRCLSEKGKAPRVVMICITCVDALLGTDMERVCRKAQEKVPGVRVRPCYMYALTREGRKPPMVHVRQSIYEILEPKKKKPSSVNLLGFFAPLQEDSELLRFLEGAGVRKVRQIGACDGFDDFMDMAEANFNLVLHPEARPAAYDLQKRLGIPFIELSRFYQIDRIRAQYAALGNVLGTRFAQEAYEEEAMEAVSGFREAFPGAVFSVGEGMNGDPFELACALVREGFEVREIFGTVGEAAFVWIRLLAALSPQTRICSNLHPSMLQYKADRDVTITIGRDAGWYHPVIPNVRWNTDVQPFGYRAVTGLFRALKEAMETGSRGSWSSQISLGRTASCGAADAEPRVAGIREKSTPQGRNTPCGERKKPPRGFMRYTTPFAPDQSGAVSVLYDMGGICVVCDAGGCTGNICGFDEPRWFRQQSAVFSAGLRDMDAILGRDDHLVEKLADACRTVPASFAAIVGTPVPAVIGTDYRALCRMASKKTGIPVLGVNTNGMEYYDRGMEKTYSALLDAFCQVSGQKEPGLRTVSRRTDARQDEPVPETVEGRADAGQKEPGPGPVAAGRADAGSGKRALIREGARSIGIWGFSPLDFEGILEPEDLAGWVCVQGFDRMLCCGAGTKAEDLQELSRVEKNIVLSPAGAAAARRLEKQFETPWEYCIPDLQRILELAVSGAVRGEDAVPGASEGQPALHPAVPGAFIGEDAVSSAAGGQSAAAGTVRGEDAVPGTAKGMSAVPLIAALFKGKRVLVVHQQVLAHKLCRLLREYGAMADAASFFMMNQDLLQQGDMQLREETDLRELVLQRQYDFVIADRALEPILEDLPAVFLHLPHFAVSGELSLPG